MASWQALGGFYSVNSVNFNSLTFTLNPIACQITEPCEIRNVIYALSRVKLGFLREIDMRSL